MPKDGTPAVSIITFHEQVIGAHAYIQKAKNDIKLLEGYDFLQRAFIDYSGELRVNKSDMRIAAIALANDLTLLTRNRRDFERIPDLVFEDWIAD